MAGARNTEGTDLDSKIDALVASYATYEAVAISGEDSSASKRYFINSLFNKLGANASLERIFRNEIGFNRFGYTPTGSPNIVEIDPESVA